MRSTRAARAARGRPNPLPAPPTDTKDTPVAQFVHNQHPTMKASRPHAHARCVAAVASSSRVQMSSMSKSSSEPSERGAPWWADPAGGAAGFTACVPTFSVMEKSTCIRNDELTGLIHICNTHTTSLNRLTTLAQGFTHKLARTLQPSTHTPTLVRTCWHCSDTPAQHAPRFARTGMPCHTCTGTQSRAPNTRTHPNLHTHALACTQPHTQTVPFTTCI